MSRGLRNNNPGNIRHSAEQWRGEIVLPEMSDGGDANFKSFCSMAWGYRAMFKLLHNYSVRYGCKTLRQMIFRWAPPNENDSEAYVMAVSRWAGIAADKVIDTLDSRVMCAVVSAMSRMENGVLACQSDVDDGWRLFAEEFGV